MVDFRSASLDETRNVKYGVKQSRLNTALNFLEAYNKQDECNLEKLAISYVMAQKGITMYQENSASIKKLAEGHYTIKQNGINPTDKEISLIEETYKEIKQNHSKIFKSFFESYKRKIEKQYREDFIQNAYDDLKKAWKIYCICNNEDEEEFSLEKMERLYNNIQGKTEEPNPNNYDER